MKQYKHSNVNSRLKIKRESETIATCFLIDEPKVYNVKGELVFKTIICKKENLIEI